MFHIFNILIRDITKMKGVVTMKEGTGRAERVVAFLCELEKKYGMSPLVAYVEGTLSTNDRIAYEIANEYADV